MQKEKQKQRKKLYPDMPYERFLAYGAEHLTECELLAIIIRTGTREASALEVAKQVLQMANPLKEGLLGLYDITLEQLKSIRGIGEVKAIKIKCLTELSMRISRARARQGLEFHSARTVADYFMEQLRHKKTECVVLVCLDAKGQLLRETLMSNGSVRMSLISAREIYLEALDSKAVSIILIHNHPSGNPSPSSSDRKVTENICKVGNMLDIPLLDHIIIGDNSYTSFKELSLI